MEITDINGITITVTDLQGALKQAERFKGYCHEGKTFQGFDKIAAAYWTDIHTKLLQLTGDNNKTEDHEQPGR